MQTCAGGYELVMPASSYLLTRLPWVTALCVYCHTLQEGANAHDPGSDWSGDSTFRARLQRLMDCQEEESPAEPRGGWDAWQSDEDGNIAGAGGAGAVAAPLVAFLSLVQHMEGPHTALPPVGRCGVINASKGTKAMPLW
jgi:hypothetical protein